MKKKLLTKPQKHKRSWDYYKQINANKTDDPKEMDKFLEMYNVLRHN